MSRPIRVVFDAHAIAPQRSGIGDYSYYLVAALLEGFTGDVELSLFSTDRITRVHTLEDVDAVTADNAPGSLYSAGNQRILPGLLRRGMYDLLHTPDYAIPLMNRRVPMVATIHDIVPVALPHMLNKSKKVKLLWLYKWYVQKAMKLCRAIITDSEFSKSEMQKHFTVPGENIHPIHIAQVQEPTEDEKPEDVIPGLPDGRYFLFVGRHEPYKGIRQLLEAFASVKADIASEVDKLVFVGKVDERYPWQDISRELGLEDDIIFTGYVTEGQLSWAYRHARGFVFPSLYEGFGFPPLDAMAHGTPVAASNRASVPEVVGNAALLFDPEESKTFQDALINLAINGNLRTELIENGRRRIRDFSWELTAQKTVEVYRKALQR